MPDWEKWRRASLQAAAGLPAPGDPMEEQTCSFPHLGLWVINSFPRESKPEVHVGFYVLPFVEVKRAH